MTSTGPSWTTDEFHENFSFQSLFPPLHLFLCYIIHVLSLSSFLLDAVLAQENIGAKDGSIDSHLKAAK
jgi:hypothetical protein